MYGHSYVHYVTSIVPFQTLYSAKSNSTFLYQYLTKESKTNEINKITGFIRVDFIRT